MRYTTSPSVVMYRQLTSTPSLRSPIGAAAESSTSIKTTCVSPVGSVARKRPFSRHMARPSEMEGTVEVLWAVRRTETGGICRRSHHPPGASGWPDLGGLPFGHAFLLPRRRGVGSDGGGWGWAGCQPSARAHPGPVGAAALPSRHPARAIRATSS